jgi:Fe-S cluster biosynthesis and repair protein YggX
MAIFGDKFKCARCGQKTEPIGYAPVPTELGQKIGEEMCMDCWAEWQKKQMQLINHFGLDVTKPESQEYLFDNMRIFFYDDGSGLATIDTSKEGSVNW